ncbi:DUF7261 family protein [Halovenus salina]|uniref:DUF7261 family protein n=1 Tax=Halovenus salina TaxID=1510225 RepID=UPI002260BBDA|nr:hypothetical protein [Halovenus salina]
MSRQLGQGGPRRRDRGQLVLVAALALSLVLVSLGVAYLQLGYDSDIDRPDQQPAQQLERVLDRAVHNASAGISADYSWADRDSAVRAATDKLDETMKRLETSRLRDGHVYSITRNETRAIAWRSANCPSGPDRQFGSCDSEDGVVVQERHGQTHVLAVAFDFVITTPDAELSVTLTIER